jgi:hypothetical protein
VDGLFSAAFMFSTCRGFRSCVAAWNAFNAAARMAFEHDFTQIPDMSFAPLPPDVSLRDLVPPSLYASVEDRCRALSIDIANASRYRDNADQQ